MDTDNSNLHDRLDPLDAEQLRHDLQTAAEVVLSNGLTTRGIGGAWVGKYGPVSIPGALNVAICGDVQIRTTEPYLVRRKNLAVDMLDRVVGSPVTTWNIDGKATKQQAIELILKARDLVSHRPLLD